MKKSTILRTIIMLFTLVNSILVMCGKDKLPFTEDELYQTLSGIATVVSTLSVWWYNNSFTKKAQAADRYLNKLKTDAETVGDVEC